MNCLSRLKILDHPCVQICLFVLIFCFFNFESAVATLNDSSQASTRPVLLGDSAKNSRSSNRTLIQIENCYSVVSENVVKFLNLNLSLYDFQQIINLKPGNALYFGKRIAQEGTSLTLTCIQRPTARAPFTGRAEWRLNAESIEQHYSTRNHQKTKKSFPMFYQTEQWFCRNLNLSVHKLTIKKVEFLNQGEYECIDPGDVGKPKNNLFVQVLITDWDDFNVNFLSHVYYDILTTDSKLVKYCPLSSPSWYKWSNKLLTNGQPTIAISEPGLYHCHSELLNRRINFYVFGKCAPFIDLISIFNNHASSSFFLSESPKIKHFSVSGSVAVGGQLKFECNASGSYPLAELQWFIGMCVEHIVFTGFDNVAHCV